MYHATSMRFLAAQKRLRKRFIQERFQARMAQKPHGYCVLCFY
jgi:hypothetical protein